MPRIVLLGFPHHDNVGDSAIWAGEHLALARYGCDVVFSGGRAGYSASRLRSLMRRDDVICIHGGGCMGDLWPTEQRFRERVVSDFHNHRIIQFPQSIQFGDDHALMRARTVLDAHPDLTLLVRDTESMALAAQNFRAKSALCPDLALLLDLTPGSPEGERIMWLARRDHEAAHRPPDDLDAGVRVVDWAQQGWSAARNDAGVHVPLATRILLSRAGAVLDGPVWAQRRHQAQALVVARRIDGGRRLLSGARVVVTDRLHGHILCLLMGVPHVILDTLHGKMFAFHRTWTAGSPLTHLDHSAAGALATARRLAQPTAGAAG